MSLFSYCSFICCFLSYLIYPIHLVLSTVQIVVYFFLLDSIFASRLNHDKKVMVANLYGVSIRLLKTILYVEYCPTASCVNCTTRCWLIVFFPPIKGEHLFLFYFWYCEIDFPSFFLARTTLCHLCERIACSHHSICVRVSDRFISRFFFFLHRVMQNF